MSGGLSSTTNLRRYIGRLRFQQEEQGFDNSYKIWLQILFELLPIPLHSDDKASNGAHISATVDLVSSTTSVALKARVCEHLSMKTGFRLTNKDEDTNSK
jgi:hypothetical protein